MKKAIITISFFACLVLPFLATEVYATTDVGSWTLTIDQQVDGTLSPEISYEVLLLKNNGSIIAIYSNFDKNDSIFSGTEYSTGKTPVITLLQRVDDYIATYIGKKVSSTQYEGTWVDVGGHSGEFRLVRH